MIRNSHANAQPAAAVAGNNSVILGWPLKTGRNFRRLSGSTGLPNRLTRWSLEYKGNLPIKRYHLQMKNYSTGGADWLDMDDKIPSNATSYTVRYLAPAVTYGFQLAAVNEAGHSNWEAKNLTMPADGKFQRFHS
ncbi:fibronectin type-III domain-containing protein [Caerostris extrusa]|uniref:Fibronectin type-III domain-containing protein n=1 Tax=Caerostris extrusa TaxID=172846 RepID=A0AAV4RXZ5_CAEEX|nr:fibronectin type-III domain-containing protein [Caerostris extrusa]